MEKTVKNGKNGNINECTICDFKCKWKSDLTRHFTTAKHKKNENVNNQQHLATLTNEKKNQTSFETKFTCKICFKAYNERSGLWRHSKKCKPTEVVSETTVINMAEPQKMKLTEETVVELLKQNNEFKTMLVKQQNKITELSNRVTVTNNNNTNNITNNQFNLNFFLNETCKDAMNIKDFIENIEIQLKELENVGHSGYVTGITDIILSRLKQLDISKRPLHCTDLKREVLYIRDENEWNKDNADKSKIKNMITKVASKNYRKIPEWRTENPECKELEHQQYEFCIKLMRNSLGDLGDEQIKLENKIIKNIAKEVIVDKNI
jgi:hypothetical protein